MSDTSQRPPEGLVLSHEAPDERALWTKLRRVIGQIPFTEDLLAGYYCALDGATPPYVRAVLLGAVAYFLLPFDVVPDFVAVLGFADDASVLAAAISAVGRNIQPRHRERAREAAERLRR